MKKIVILNSYRLTDRSPYDSVRIRHFLKGLEEEGYTKDKNLHVEVIDSNDLSVIESTLEQKVKDAIDLIHAVGTPNAVIAGRLTRNIPVIPVVYYGAHPDGVGKEDCSNSNTCGLILTLPFTASYKNFRFIREFLPAVQSIYVPFYEKTVFCPRIMKEKHRVFRSRNRGSAWIPMDSEYIGYKSLAGLCYIIGISYFEFVYRNIEELSTVLASMEPEGSLVMPYNDSIHCNGVPELLCESSIKRGIPLIWNNNPEATQIGALAAIAGCFKEAGSVTGKMAGRILNGTKPSDIGFPIASKSYASINLKTAEIFGLELPSEVLDYFDEVVT